MTNTANKKDLVFQKVGIFIDAENIEMSGLKHHEGRTDYKKILAHVGDREIIRILYYKPEYKEISAEFEHFWHSLGGEIKRPAKNADTFLVIDAVTMAEKLDVAIIVGGDKDFLPLIWYLKSRGCRVEIWSWPEATSPEMQTAADHYVPLTPEFMIEGEEGRPRPERKSAPTTSTPPSGGRASAGAPASGSGAQTKPQTQRSAPQGSQQSRKKAGTYRPS